MGKYEIIIFRDGSETLELVKIPSGHVGHGASVGPVQHWTGSNTNLYYCN
jgi:hypothetical protein